MLQNKSFARKTKAGQIKKVSIPLSLSRLQEVREHYLRDDVNCGSHACAACDATSACLGSSVPTVIIVDTNVVLNQIDLLENPAIDDVVVLSIVLEEVKNKNLAVFNRLKALCTNPARKFYVFANEHFRATSVVQLAGESPNHRNGRAIWEAAKWYIGHLAGKTQIVLITNDRENKSKAIMEGLSAETVESHVKSLGQPDLLDLVVRPTCEDMEMEDVENLRPSKGKIIINPFQRFHLACYMEYIIKGSFKSIVIIHLKLMLEVGA